MIEFSFLIFTQFGKERLTIIGGRGGTKNEPSKKSMIFWEGVIHRNEDFFQKIGDYF